MVRIVTTLVFALLLSLSTLAVAGGEQCAKEAHAAAQEKAKHGWIGLEVDKSAAGYVVRAIEPGSPAAQAGFKKGDVLVSLNGIALDEANHEALKKAKASLKIGSQVTYTIARNGARSQITATLAAVPPAVLARWEKEYNTGETVAQNN